MQSPADFRAAVEELTAGDPALAAIVSTHSLPSFWHRPPGFATLVLLILEQQVSLASAAAAYRRLEARTGPPTPERFLRLTDDELRADGFSRQKVRYGRALAADIAEGRLDLTALDRLPDDEARAELIARPGIGPWTADVYLLSCLRRPDVWPVGDRALQVAAAEVLGLDTVPDASSLEQLGQGWRPHRSTASRLLWHAYLSRRGR